MTHVDYILFLKLICALTALLNLMVELMLDFGKVLENILHLLE